MSLDCINVSEAIWDSVRKGAGLAEDVLCHIQACSSCADVLAEAQDCREALTSIKPCPAVPDCRSAVMARISGRRRGFAPVWACTCAATMAAAVICGMLIRNDVVPATPSPAPRIVEAPDFKTNSEPVPLPDARPEARSDKPAVQRSLRRTGPYKASFRRFASAPRPQRKPRIQAVVPNVSAAAGETPKTAVTSSQEGSSAFASVTWQTGSRQEDICQYSYTVTDPATGEVVKCSVKREGNAVEINMESEPAGSEEKPEKESKTDETV